MNKSGYRAVAEHQHKFTALFFFSPEWFIPSLKMHLGNVKYLLHMDVLKNCPALPEVFHACQDTSPRDLKFKRFPARVCRKTTRPVREWGPSYPLLGAKWQSAGISSLWHLQSNLLFFLTETSGLRWLMFATEEGSAHEECPCSGPSDHCTLSHPSKLSLIPIWCSQMDRDNQSKTLPLNPQN